MPRPFDAHSLTSVLFAKPASVAVTRNDFGCTTDILKSSSPLFLNLIPITPVVARPAERNVSSSTEHLTEKPLLLTKITSFFFVTSCAEITRSFGFKLIPIIPPLRLERQKITDEFDELSKSIKDYKDILAKPERQRKIIGEELSEIAEKYGDDRRSQFVAQEGDKSAEDFIKAEDVVVTISRGGYIKRTKSDLYRAQKRGGKGIKGASLREDDVIEHLFVASTHDWLLVFTDRGRVYRTKVHELPDKGRDAKGQHVANLLSFQPV